ncbi:DUF485 domain-containing protein [Heyndrickxia camelliae]|uniref:DUF485 domain-containing protein n=1 Tax=Heyndrickxia camelliae TaxID=1707093 RepID=A0A2N3LPH9_9BACI|nr:DUF485 domain-containing protein [Heyndrickxia camelliae]PKR86582.1 DUF485 domain-containing protein [Heyndrickxia camelliae]
MRDEEKYEKIVALPGFQDMLAKKKKFILTSTLIIFILFLALPVLTSYSTVLNHTFIGPITWAWFWAFMLFIMTWFFCVLYTKKASSFDQLNEKIKEEANKELTVKEANV